MSSAMGWAVERDDDLALRASSGGVAVDGESVAGHGFSLSGKWVEAVRGRGKAQPKRIELRGI